MNDILKKYYERLSQEAIKQYQIANNAKSKGYDPVDKVEINLARDLGDRVESLLGLVGTGIKDTMNRLESQGMARDIIAFELTKMIARGEILGIDDKASRIDKAVRVGTAILTDGVLVAPTEGISKVELIRTKSGEYVSIIYSGPIRSAGGTAAALTVLLADLARRENGIPPYRADEREIRRIIEEVNIYDREVARLQYKPPDSDVEKIVRGLTVQVSGEPTENIEVVNFRDVPNINTNRIRSGVPLVLCEGIAQKSKKLKKYVEKLRLEGWDFLDKLEGIKIELKDNAVDASYLEGVVAGRPILAYPSSIGGFRIRYGRSMTNGLMAKNIHYKTLLLLNNFIANGTHIKIEKPGKGAIVTSHDRIHPPVVRLKNGDVLIDPPEEVFNEVEKILFLGDILVTYGDFLKSNIQLAKSPYVEEWWMLENPGVEVPTSPEQAFEIAKIRGTSVHPKYVLFWKNINMEELKRLVAEVNKEMSIELKPILERLYIPHKVRDGKIILDDDSYRILMLNLGGNEGIAKILQSEKEDVLEVLKEATGVKIPDVVGTYIGARMGRPEKAKEREMDGSPNILFPLGSQREFEKYINKRASNGVTGENQDEEVEIAIFECKSCRSLTIYPKCQTCGERTVLRTEGVRKKIRLGAIYNIGEEIAKLRRKHGDVEKFKGVKGLFSSKKIPEYLEKGYLRAKYNLPVNKDGTCRFDAINITITHFRPKEINVSVEKLRELGYEVDYQGAPLERDDQIAEIFPQDIVVPRAAIDYIIRASKFIDDLLVNVYNEPPFYNIKNEDDVIGTLLITQSPHTSAGVIARVIGWTEVNGIFANPFLHAAKRRNVDGDEDSIFLALDGFLNFSKEYLEDKTGGQMDAPIVVILNINPKEVDDEVYNIEVEPYSLDFYKATEQGAMPGNVKIKIVQDMLKDFNYPMFTLTHIQDKLIRGPIQSSYKSIDNMKDKIKNEIEVMDKIYAIDIRDAVTRIINDHFFPDIYGNLRKFSKQEFRCKKCNAKYRRPPLSGRCIYCNSELQLTITKGSIEKYLDIALELAEKYDIAPYYKDRLRLIKLALNNMFLDKSIGGLSDIMDRGR